MGIRGRESIIQSQVVLIGAQFTRLGLGLMVTVLLVRGLDDEGWSSFTILSTACALATLMVDAGLQPALVTELAAGASRRGAFFRRVIAIRWGLALLLLVPALGLLALLPAALPPAAIVLVLLSLPLRSWNALFAASSRNRVTALGGLAIHALFVLLVMTSLDREPAELAAWVLLLLCGRELALSLYPWLRSFLERPTEVAERGRGEPGGLVLLSVATICGAAYLYVDVFMLEAMRGPADVGHYGLATRLIIPVMVGANLLAAPFLPFLARRHDERGLPPLSDALVLGALILGAVLPASVCFESGGLLIEVVAHQWRPAAADALTTLALVPAAVAFGSDFSLALVIGRRYGLWLLVSSVGLAANVGLNLRWIPAEGAVGAARATLITEFLVAGLAGLALLLAPRSGRRWPLARVAGILVFALLPAAAVLLWSRELEPNDPSDLYFLAGAALLASLLWMILGPARKIRAQIESESTEEGDA